MGNTLKNAKEMPQKNHGRVIGIDWGRLVTGHSSDAVSLRCASANRCSKVQYHPQGSLMFALEAIRLEKNSIELQFSSKLIQSELITRSQHFQLPGHQGTTCSERRVCPQMGTKPFSMRSAFQPCHGPGDHRGWDVGMLGCYSGLIRFDLAHLGFRLGSEIILDIDLQRRVDTAKTLTSEPPEVSIQSHCISLSQLESSGVARRCSCLELS